MTLKSGVRAFKGIPFAAPPVGPLRWKEPQPAAKWDGVRKAEQFGSVCVQPSQLQRVPNNVSVDLPDSPKTSEDCLYLNVWTSAANATARQPVMVWIFGGAYTEGAGSTPHNDGENLARKGVVLVTFNYRVGPFGFFSHPELTKESGRNASGNQALADSIAVLRWVQKNIAAFGGDPGNVTIFGESAGAAMVGGLVGSPVAKGLFHRAISESGAWMGLGMGPMTPLAQAEQAATAPPAGRGGRGQPPPPPLPLPTLAELRARSTEEVVKTLRGAGMIVDGWIVPEDLSITFANGKQNAVDLIAGYEQGRALVPGRPGGRGRRRRADGVSRHDDVGHAPLRREADGPRQARLLVLLHARAAGGAWRRRPEVRTRRRDRLRVQQPGGAAHVPQLQLAEAGDGVREGPRDGRADVVLLGQFRADRRSERSRACRSGRASRIATRRRTTWARSRNTRATTS